MTDSARVRAKLSMHPQRVNEAVWYYENRGNIEVFVDFNEVKKLAERGVAVRFKIPKYRLQRSLRRMK